MSGPLQQKTSSLINSTSAKSQNYRGIRETGTLSALKGSSLDHFRNLSIGAATDLSLSGDATEDVEDVAGLQGRIRLQRTRDIETFGMSRNWMDKQRKVLQAYEYLCHIGEAKAWIEACIGREIPPVVKLEESLRDGIILAQLAKVFAPHLVRKIFTAPKLQWLHSNNIHIFFKFLEEVDMPELFRFEFTDLYDKKNIPKVIYCIHALSYILSSSGLAPEMGDLVGKLEFTDDEIRDTQRGLDAAGISLPNFKSVTKHFDDADVGLERQPLNVETEDQRIDRRLAELEPEICSFQAIIRGAISRSYVRGTEVELKESIPEIVQLQSIIKGKASRLNVSSKLSQANQQAFVLNVQSLVRRMLIRQRFLEQMKDLGALENSIRDLQSRARAGTVREIYKRQKALLDEDKETITKLQSLCRRYLYSTHSNTMKLAIHDKDTTIVEFQSFLRGCLLRRKLDAVMIELHSDQTLVSIRALQSIVRGRTSRRELLTRTSDLGVNSSSLEDLAARIRGSLVRANIAADGLDLIAAQDRVPHLQSYIRGMLLRRKLAASIGQMQEALDEIVGIQSEARGTLTRNWVDDQHDQLSASVDDVILFQSHIRGVRARFQYYRDLRSVDETEDGIVIPLQSLIRGTLVRDAYFAFLGELTRHVPGITELQSYIRGALLRADVRMFESDLENEIDEIVEVQAISRAYMVRKKLNERKQQFEQSMDQVIKIQSIIRAKQQSTAYKAITSGKNPPLATVKNFIHLLTDSDLDFQEEVELDRMRKQVVDEVHKNEQLEQFIDQLDVKIALLVKNKITLDEVIKHQHGAMPKTWSSSNDPFDFKSLNKASRRRLELYQGIFFVLQTQPAYMSRLLSGVKESRVTEMEMKTIEGSIMALFGYAQKGREEFFLLKLIAHSMASTLQIAESIPTFIKGSYMWTRLLLSYTRGTKERKFLSDIIGPWVKSIVTVEDMDLESDPLTIYHTSINREELHTGRRSQRDQNVVVDVAIKDPESRGIYIRNLQRLREYVIQFLDIVQKHVDSIPYGIRFLCRELFTALQKYYPKETEERLLSAVANVLYTRYINLAIVAPDMVGIYGSSLSQIQKKNLSQLSRIITQVSSGKVFNEDFVFLQPLNGNLTTYIASMRELCRQIIQVPDPEVHFDLDGFDDLTSTQRPTLFIKTSDIHSLHSIVIKFLEYMAPDISDPIRDAVKELGPLPSNSSEILNISRLTEVKLDLNPGFIRVEDTESEINSLIMEAKRCLLYVIRVQSGSNLLEILIKPVTDEDEQKYASILAEEKKTKFETTYSAGSTLNDLSLLNYRELKVVTLEKVIELESLGKITRNDHFQGLLNSIATDIRTKRNRRMRRQKETESVEQTLEHLSSKERYLQTQLQSYNDYIEQAMSTLQAKKGKRKAVLPFTKQFFHMRELQKTGRVPKFGSFKYSGSRLLEKGVLSELKGLPEKQYEKIDFTISSDQIGTFFIEASQGSITLPAGSIQLTLDDLLDKQFNNQQFIKLFDNMAIFNTNLLLHLIFKKFYRDD